MNTLIIKNHNNSLKTLDNDSGKHSGFIEANTQKVSINHLGNDCIVPVFSKDNETTISHHEFIHSVDNLAKELFHGEVLNMPDIRVSHVIKGRVPTAIGKPVKELKEHEKTIYYERCAFVIEVPSIQRRVGDNLLSLTIGGVRAYNQENLYSKKTMEKFKLFIGFKNLVCTNLCISTDGFSNEIRSCSTIELMNKAKELFNGYDMEMHLNHLQLLQNYILDEHQFSHFVGRLRMFQFLGNEEKRGIFPSKLNDGQITKVVRDYYECPNFGKESNGSINLWNLYNLFTEANKSSYIDSSLERNVNAFDLMQNIALSLEIGEKNWYTHN
ncbi:DUF3871 family protein [Flagellimonas zhangzhouensis]|uniref:DUF3871 family protein n=1 Tax=Flagellimonas zhangzhouensis TaxID=1073328 RepID=A0A1H2UA33_9FLAO|nr:DUF3871 family protein [Allomuricauda zhangzhouensis]SDQ18790.1 protein of unknown function [Allomuricauda zhangzhouensis]SDW53016.1 protein of unknown function [Allomuricauda zhangzhouensis]